MTFWIAPVLIALAVALVLLRSFARDRGPGLSAAASDMAVYRDQLSEVDRDVARGVLTEAEAETVRTEVSRRLLDADRRASARTLTGGGLTLGIVLAVALPVAAAFLLYARVGAPGTSDLPMDDRLSALAEAAANRPSQAEAEQLAAPGLPKPADPDAAFLDLMTKLRAAIAERPTDIQGLTLLTQNEARLGNFTAARAAQQQLVAAYGADVPVDELLSLVDIMVYAAGGFVSPEAEAVLAEIVRRDPENPAARYYVGLFHAQSGRADLAFRVWRRLLESSAPDDPWVPVIRDNIIDLAAAAGVEYAPPTMRGPTAADIAAAGDMSVEDRQEMIRTMVQGLSDRLASDGGPPEDWARLITALGVLGETTRARAIADEAEQVFAAAPDALETIRAARARLDQ